MPLGEQKFCPPFFFKGVNMSVRLDDLKIRGLMIYQDSDLFRFGTDAVLLADFCRRKKYKNAVDLCCGTGVIPLLLADGCNGKIYGVEISQEASFLAEKSVAYNNLEEKIQIVNADLKTVNEKDPPLPLAFFDLVSVNPPYSPENSGKIASGHRGLARTEGGCSLEDVISAASRLLKYGGRFCMVNRPERLADIFCLMRKYGIEPKVLKPVETAENRKPELILAEGKKGAAPGLIFEAPAKIYDGYEYKNL